MLQGKVILVADDDEAMSEIYAERVEAEGAIVLKAIDGVDTIQKINEFHPHLVILDIMMPEMNGFEVLEKIKKDPVSRNIPVMILTALSDTKNRARGTELGAVEYIVKSEVMPIEVLRRIKDYVSIEPVSIGQ
ncbi:MAG: response regulator [Candidatus Berkelbacteria bacterium]